MDTNQSLAGVLLWILTFISGQFAALVLPNGNTPSNTVAILGSNVTLNLTYHKCNWMHISTDRQQTDIYSDVIDATFQNTKYVVKHELDRCDLTIKNATFADAGVYRYGNGDGHGVVLFVVDHNPACGVVDPLHRKEGVVEGENIELNCSVSVSNNEINPKPTMTWLTEHGTEEVTNEIKREEGAGTITISSSYILKANSTDGQFARCFVRLHSIPSVNDPAVSRDMLNFNSLCVTEKPTILSPVHNVRLLNDTSGTMKPGDTVVCRADGVPQVRYKWLKEDVAVGNASELVLSSVAGLHHYTCLAYNVIHGNTRTREVKVLILINESVENSLKLDDRFAHHYILYGFVAILAGILGVLTFCLAGKAFFGKNFTKSNRRLFCRNKPTLQLNEAAGSAAENQNNELELQGLLSEKNQSSHLITNDSRSVVVEAISKANDPRHVCIYNIADHMYLNGTNVSELMYNLRNQQTVAVQKTP